MIYTAPTSEPGLDSPNCDRCTIYLVSFEYPDEWEKEVCLFVQEGDPYSGWALRVHDYPWTIAHRSHEFDRTHGFKGMRLLGEMDAPKLDRLVEISTEVAAENQDTDADTFALAEKVWIRAIQDGVCVPVAAPAESEYIPPLDPEGHLTVFN